MLPPIYMLAIDHRWQWEEWCDGAGIDRSRIPEAKSLAAEAFLAARDRSPLIQRSGALLVDLTYGRAAYDAARRAGVRAGNPAERAGAFPLEWADAFGAALPGDFVKVLVRHRSDVAADIVLSQQRKLLDLQKWCVSAGKPLVIEVLVAPARGEEDNFDAQGRPRLLAAYIRDSYALGILPQYWKIEGMPDAAAVRQIEAAIAERVGPRQLILGKGAGMDEVRRWFASAAGAPSASGFAIGRTVYWDAARQWLRGELSRDAAIAAIANNYQKVVDLWEQSRAAV